MQWLMIALGAALGAVLRGWLARYNGLHHWLPVGTLFANVLGGLLMGIALAIAERLSPLVRVMITTGFLGGLTTFSTFSAEVVTLFLNKHISHALLLIGLHVTLTLCATALAFYLAKALNHLT